ncbi:MAG: transposase family protein [Planctomycetia bacterium]|nr:transposase family protein [Planctomycetia bacterium]
MGRKCRTMTVKDVAKDFRLDWDTVKTLDKEYMKKHFGGIQ